MIFIRGILIKNEDMLTSIGNDVEKRTLCTAGGNVSWYSYFGNRMKVPQNIKNRTII